MKKLNQNGFTLIEILVAIGILAAMSAMMGSTVQSVMRVKALGERRTDVRHMLQVGINKLTDDLTMAFLADTTFQGKDNAYLTGFSGEEEEMNFSTMTHIHFVKNAHDTDQVDVGYKLKRNDNKTYDLMRRETNYLMSDLDKGGKSFPLISNIKSFALEYYDSNKKEWEKKWDTDSVSFAGRLPQMVKITLLIEDLEDDEDESSKREYHYESVVPLPLYNSKISF